MPKEQQTKMDIQAQYAEEVRWRTATRIAELNVAYTHKRQTLCSEKNVSPIRRQHEKKNAQSKRKKDLLTVRGQKLLEDTKRKMRAAQKARTRTRLDKLDFAACEALGNELLHRLWDLEHELLAQAEEPWSDDEDVTPQLNFRNTNVRTVEHNDNASYPIYASTHVERDGESSCVTNNLEIETPD
jgi:hypothetical protein